MDIAGSGSVTEQTVAPLQVRSPLQAPSAKAMTTFGFAVVVGALLFLICIGGIDYATGPELRFSLYYALPVVLVAWFLGRNAGYAIALLSALIWLTAELGGAARYTTPFYAVINSITRLLIMLLAAFMVSALREFSNGLNKTVAERTRALRDLSIRLSQAEESERSHLAHELHDGLGQMLTLVKLHLNSAIGEASAGTISTQKLEEVTGLVSELIDRCRSLTFDLHPTMLETLGLVPTLRQHCEQFSRYSGAEVIVSESGDRLPISTVLAGYLFRATRELMTNAIKHGKARQMVVSILWMPAAIRIMVDDDGSGFDPRTMVPGAGKTGIGLPGIRERVQALQGVLRIESAREHGTRVVIEVPISASEQS